MSRKILNPVALSGRESHTPISYLNLKVHVFTKSNSLLGMYFVHCAICRLNSNASDRDALLYDTLSFRRGKPRPSKFGAKARGL